MRALIVFPEAPYPLRGGGALRSAAMLGYLAQRYETSAIFFREPGSADPRAAVPEGLIADTLLIELPAHSKSPLARLSRNAVRAVRGVPPLNDRFSGFEDEIAAFVTGRSFDLCVFEHFWTAGYAGTLRTSSRRLVLDLHNVESELYRRWAETSQWPVSAIHRRFATAAGRLEAELLPGFDMVLAPSAVEGALVYPNTIPSGDRLLCPKRQRIVFSANFDYLPNREGVAWFDRHIWPKLRARYPGLRWLLAGKCPPPVNASSGIDVTGEIDDMLPVLAESSAAVVPILSGSGTRVKILEAWRAGTAVISTPLGAEGLPVRHGEHLLLAARPAEFASAVGAILDDPPLSARIELAGRKLFSEHFTWQAGWRILESLGV